MVYNQTVGFDFCLISVCSASAWFGLSFWFGYGFGRNFD